MKRLFIVGASVLQLPAIKHAKELGYYVGVADYDPHAVGIPFADEYYNVSTIDEEGVCQAAKDFGADGIITLATDMPMRSVAYTCEKLGLVGISYDTAIKATDKGEMIRVFEETGVEHPWYYVVSSPMDVMDIIHKVTYPCIAKPTDNSGSRGIMLAHNPEELLTAVAYSAKNGRGGNVIIEEYMEGPEVSVEVIAYRGIPYVLQITDKMTTGAPHFVEIGHTQPSRLSEEIQQRIRDLACRAVVSLGITDGPAHVEMIVTKDGPKMVELGARMGGGCITTHLVPLSTGIDMIKATIDSAFGLAPDIKPQFKKGAAIRFFLPPYGVIQDVSGVELAASIPGIQEITFTKQIGEKSLPLTSGADRVGYVIAQGDSPEQAGTQCSQAICAINFTIQN